MPENCIKYAVKEHGCVCGGVKRIINKTNVNDGKRTSENSGSENR